MGYHERMWSDELPTRIVVRHCGLRLDGGTVHLIATDEFGRQVDITLASSWPGSSTLVAGRLYYEGDLVPMRSEREGRIVKLLREAEAEAPQAPTRQPSRMTVIGKDIEEFLEQTPEENCKEFIRLIVDSVEAEDYTRLATDDERAFAEETNRDDWEQSSGRKKRRPWRRGR